MEKTVAVIKPASSERENKGLSAFFRYEFYGEVNIVKVEKCCSTRLINVSRHCLL